MDGRSQDRFSSLEAAVEAVDYEIAALGRAALASARADAAWRNAPAPSADSGAQTARLRGEALRLSAWQRVHGSGRAT